MADGNIFISYRRGLDSNAAGRLYDRLERQFDRAHLFFDIDSIPLGVDFAEHIDGEVAKCDVQLVVIGPGWLEEAERLADPDDFVRIEIEAALKRPDIPVIPVLLEGADMPPRDDLPDSLHPLVRRNAIVLSHAQFAQIVDGRLSEALKDTLLRPGVLTQTEETPADGRTGTEPVPASASAGTSDAQDVTTLSGAGRPARPAKTSAGPNRDKPSSVSDEPSDSGLASGKVAERRETFRNTKPKKMALISSFLGSPTQLRRRILVVGLLTTLAGLAYVVYATSFANTRGFTKIGDGSCANRLRVFGFDRTVSGLSLEECMEQCRGTQDCTGVTSFATQERNCYVHTATINDVFELSQDRRAVCYARR